MKTINEHTNTNGSPYYSTQDEDGKTIYSFSRDFEDIWTQTDQDAEDGFLAELKNGNSGKFCDRAAALDFIAAEYDLDADDLGVWTDEDGRELVWPTQEAADAAEDSSDVIATIVTPA
jgi:hypothetical protein